jgi:hypothetical protein
LLRGPEEGLEACDLAENGGKQLAVDGFLSSTWAWACSGEMSPNSACMHSTPVRPVVRRIRSATSISRPRRRVNSTQLRWCEGMESIMVPSMSKIRAWTIKRLASARFR